MNLIDHNPSCREAAWQLQFKRHRDKNKYRAKCLGCGKTTQLTAIEAATWNALSDRTIKVGIPEIIEEDAKVS